MPTVGWAALGASQVGPLCDLLLRKNPGEQELNGACPLCPTQWISPGIVPTCRAQLHLSSRPRVWAGPENQVPRRCQELPP